MGITMDMLDRYGFPCTEVVVTFTAAVSGRMVLLDNQPWDGHWFRMLLIVDIVAHRDSPTRHRAEPDARRHAVKWGTLAGLVTVA